jgi:hypothetical protein
MISAGNKDMASWTSMLTVLKEACPIITQEQVAEQVDETAWVHRNSY